MVTVCTKLCNSSLSNTTSPETKPYIANTTPASAANSIPSVQTVTAAGGQGGRKLQSYGPDGCKDACKTVPLVEQTDECSTKVNWTLSCTPEPVKSCKPKCTQDCKPECTTVHPSPSPSPVYNVLPEKSPDTDAAKDTSSITSEVKSVRAPFTTLKEAISSFFGYSGHRKVGGFGWSLQVGH